MTYDYGAAAKRHFEDADCLEEGGASHRGNADQLYGFAAECGLLRMLVHHGAATSSTEGDISDDAIPREHVDRLWDAAMSFLDGHDGAAIAAQLRAPQGKNPFAQWRTKHRYQARGESDAAVVSVHRRAAERVITAMQTLATPPRGGKK